MIYALFAIPIVMIAFLWWRWTSVSRGARQRDEKLLRVLEPVAQRLAAKEQVDEAEIAALARQPQYRPMLYDMLAYFERIDLFPLGDLAPVAQGEGRLAYWMMHPNELQDAPSEIELVEEVVRQRHGLDLKFFVYRYRMAAGHWAHKDGWLLGLAGPFLEKDAPYSGPAGGFSRCGDKEGVIKPAELVDWYLGMMEKKGMGPRAGADDQ
jgi:hypothetical protein